MKKERIFGYVDNLSAKNPLCLEVQDDVDACSQHVIADAISDATLR